jgi:hypothetical protein
LMLTADELDICLFPLFQVGLGRFIHGLQLKVARFAYQYFSQLSVAGSSISLNDPVSFRMNSLRSKNLSQ